MDRPLKESLIVICGATATGKSGLALELAQRLDTIIISADSRQVYREFDIGTAKPSLAQQQLVPHYLIDICEPTETLTLAQYQRQVQNLISFFHSSKQENNVTNCFVPPLLVGGTGLYIQSIVKGLKIPPVSPQPTLRKQLQSLGQKQLYGFLSQVDCQAAAKIHANDQVRTLRALEVFYVTGKPISEQQGEVPPAYPIRQIGLDCDPEILKQRIELRTEKMIEMGLVEEVNYLGEKYGWNLPLLNTLGYREIREHLTNNLSLDVAREMIVLHTCQFAKRQRTWFRAISDIVWFDINSP
ncbi:MAG: tRNA (adenosine(37)-N6)-dimethylallyltransferase MiaA, partial [Snowella sp.]